jgi:hypothetical protein
MGHPVWMDNLVACSLQIVIPAAAGILLAYISRLYIPKVSPIYWQALLLVCLLLPVLQRCSIRRLLHSRFRRQFRPIRFRECG